MDYNRDRQVYDNFKLNAHVYPLDALSSQTISQAVLGYFHCLFSKNRMQDFSIKIRYTNRNLLETSYL